MSAPVRVYSGTDVHRILDELDEAIGTRDHRIFQRAGHLVVVRGILAEDAKRLKVAFAPDDLILAPLKRETLLPSITEHVEYGCDVPDEERGQKWKAAVPNQDVTSSFLGKRYWAHIRPIRAVSKTPIPHLDGTIATDGYDRETRTLVASNIDLPELPAKVSREDAMRALEELVEPFAEFHFAGPSHRYVSAALTLTLLLRPSIGGNVPFFIFRAPQKDCGKSLVAKVACAIATGSVPGANTWSGEKEEQAKALSGVAMAGLSVCFFDNVGTGSSIGGAELDRVATCDGETSFRVLGHNELRSLPWSAVIVFTSNRARIEGDTDRRSIVSDLTRRAQPIERFAHDDLIEYVKRHRGRLLAAAFTLIRGWVQAGRPTEDVRRLASFELWSRTVPSMIKWATPDAIDIRTLVQDTTGTDADEVEYNLLKAIHGYLYAYSLNATTVKAMIGKVFSSEVGGGAGDRLEQRDAKDALREAIDALECTTGRGDNVQFDKRKFGKKLASMADVFYAPYRLEKAGVYEGYARWNVTKTAEPEPGPGRGASTVNGAANAEEHPPEEPGFFDDLIKP